MSDFIESATEMQPVSLQDTLTSSQSLYHVTVFSFGVQGKPIIQMKELSISIYTVT